MTDEAQIITYLTEKDMVNPDGSIKHQYFHTVYRFQYPPYGYIPFYLKGYNKARRKFTIIVLTDKRELDYVPLDYPCVAISEVDAQAIVEHRRGSPTKREVTTMVELSNQNVATATEEVTPKKKGRTANDGRTPIRQLANAGFGEGKNQDEIVAAVRELYPEKTEKSIRSLVSLYRYHHKKKTGTK